MMRHRLPHLRASLIALSALSLGASSLGASDAKWAIQPAAALSMAPYTLSELWSESQVIARGSITATRVYRERGRVWTELTFTQSARPLKDTRADTSAPIKFVLPGGAIGGITQRVPGVPQLKRGQALIVFLRCRAHSTCAPVGFGQGLWSPSSSVEGRWLPMTQGVAWVGSAPPDEVSDGSLTLDQLMTDPHRAVPERAPTLRSR